MKVKRHLLELFALLVVVALLGWKFWPTEKSAPLPAITASASPSAKTTALSVVASKAAVEAPVVPPAEISSTPDNLSEANNGSSLYDASKARSMLSNPAGSTDEDYNAIVKGSPGLAKLGNILVQTAALTQAIAPIDSSTKLPIVVTDLGKIALTENQQEMRKLVSGDEAILTLIALPATVPHNGYNFSVSVNFLYPNANKSFEDVGLQAGTLVQPGRGAVIRDFATGNEIHFIPEFTEPAVASP